jgi:hypothetical protein
MFENRVLKTIFGHKKDEMAWEWKQLHNEEIYNLYFSPNRLITRVIVSGRVRLAEFIILVIVCVAASRCVILLPVDNFFTFIHLFHIDTPQDTEPKTFHKLR